MSLYEYAYCNSLKRNARIQTDAIGAIGAAPGCIASKQKNPRFIFSTRLTKYELRKYSATFEIHMRIDQLHISQKSKICANRYQILTVLLSSCGMEGGCGSAVHPSDKHDLHSNGCSVKLFDANVIGESAISR